MLLEDYLDKGVLLSHLMAVSKQNEITFAPGKVTVKGKDGTVTDACFSGIGVTICSIEVAIELCNELN